MSRITGTDALNMMEAYNAIYAPQELTEEQVWEEVEAWVNSLVEEGYDLSEYTWEDMYEEYLSEIPTSDQMANRRPISNAPYQSRFARPMNAGTPQTYGGGRTPVRTVRPQIGGLPANYRGQELQQAARARASQVGTPRQGTAGGPTTGGNTPIGPSPTRPAAQAPAARPVAQAPAARPAPAPARPAVQTSTRPAAQAPAGEVAKPTPTATTTPTVPARTFNPLMQRTFDYQTGNAPSQIAAASAGKPIPSGTALGSAANPQVRAALNLPAKPSLAAPAPRPVPVAAPATTPAPAATARPNLQQSIRNRRLNMDLDLFDIVKGYLIDEGYAETEQAAAVIMANMSEEWKESILDEGFKKMNRSKIEKQAERLGGDRGNILRYLANRMDTPEERKYSTSKARKNRSGSGEYRQAQHLRARDDAKADFEKYGLR
jgi:hypothetical protein